MSIVRRWRADWRQGQDKPWRLNHIVRLSVKFDKPKPFLFVSVYRVRHILRRPKNKGNEASIHMAGQVVPCSTACAPWGPSNFHASRATWNWWMPLLQCRDEIEVRNAGSCRPSRLATCLYYYTGALILSPDPASGSFGVDNDVQHHSPGSRPYSSYTSSWYSSGPLKVLTEPIAPLGSERYTRFIFAFLLHLLPFILWRVPSGCWIATRFGARTAGLVHRFAFLLLGRSGHWIIFRELYGLSPLHVSLVAGFFIGIDWSLGKVVGPPTRYR